MVDVAVVVAVVEIAAAPAPPVTETVNKVQPAALADIPMVLIRVAGPVQLVLQIMVVRAVMVVVALDIAKDQQVAILVVQRAQVHVSDVKVDVLVHVQVCVIAAAVVALALAEIVLLDVLLTVVLVAVVIAVRVVVVLGVLDVATIAVVAAMGVMVVLVLV